MKKRHVLLVMFGLVIAMPTYAQWNSWDTHRAISGVLGLASQSIESAERKKEMEILARQKVEFEQSFKDAMTEAKVYEEKENWDDALEKYEEAAKLNCKYGYTDQRNISKKISVLYVKAGREDDGPSWMNNNKTILPDYSAYRYVKDNPIYTTKKNATGTKIVRVACSDKETRIEMEFEALSPNVGTYIKGATYIKGNKGGKLILDGIENITMAPAKTYIPWPYQKLRFVLIFPALPADAKDFDLIEPSSTWQFKDIKCR